MGSAPDNPDDGGAAPEAADRDVLAMVTVDETGAILGFDVGAQRLFGYAAEEVVGRDIRDLLAATPPIESGGQRRLTLGGELVTGVRRDGSHVAFEVTASTFSVLGRRCYTGLLRLVPGDREGEDDEFSFDRSLAVAHAVLETESYAIITIDERGSIQSFNRGAEQMFGYAPRDVLGRNVKVLMPESYQSEHDDYLANYHRTGERRVIGIGRRVSGRRADGSVFPLDLSVSEVPIAGGRLYTGIARDLTDLHRATEAITASEETFRLLVEGVADHALFLIDDDGRVASWNAGAERLLGYAAVEIIGHHVAVFHAAGSRDAADMLDEAAREGTAEEEGPRRRGDRSVFVASVVIAALHHADGTLRGYAVDLRDVTERRAAEEAAEHMANQLRQHQRMEAVGQLAGGVAHDFNNLLTVIRGTAALLPDAIAAGDDVAADVDAIVQSADRGAALTRQLLTFSRQEVVRPEVLDLAEVLSGVHDLLRRSLGEHIALRIGGLDGLWSVVADRSQLDQVLVNLAVNARDAMPEGGSLLIEAANVELDDTAVPADVQVQPGRFVRLAVSDTGMGMPPEVVARAFEPFFTTKPVGQGTGLGLATVYGIVTAAGGTVRLYSEPGIGTSVKCYLPATDVAAEEVEPFDAPVPDGRDRCVLVVEDEDGVRDLARRLLVRAGFQVLTAADGAEAMLRVGDPTLPIDLILTDVVMPGISGRELTERARAHRPGVAVLFMSGYTAGILEPHGLPDHAELLEKPFTPGSLLHAVAVVLGDLDGTPATD